MFSFFKRLFAVAEVDGITFWSRDAFDEYMVEKDREAKGVHMYCVDGISDAAAGKCIDILERHGVFDYKKIVCMCGVNIIYYYSTKKLIRVY